MVKTYKSWVRKLGIIDWEQLFYLEELVKNLKSRLRTWKSWIIIKRVEDCWLIVDYELGLFVEKTSRGNKTFERVG